jgi:hypothetical protein
VWRKLGRIGRRCDFMGKVLMGRRAEGRSLVVVKGEARKVSELIFHQ